MTAVLTALGPIVRYGPSRVSINTATALHDIYNHKANVQKSSYYSIFSHYFKASSVLTALTAKNMAASGESLAKDFLIALFRRWKTTS